MIPIDYSLVKITRFPSSHSIRIWDLLCIIYLYTHKKLGLIRLFWRYVKKSHTCRQNNPKLKMNGIRSFFYFSFVQKKKKCSLNFHTEMKALMCYLEHKCNVEQTWSHTHTHTHTHRYDCRSPAESICIEFGK